MICRNKFFEPFKTEQSLLHYVWATHVFCLLLALIIRPPSSKQVPQQMNEIQQTARAIAEVLEDGENGLPGLMRQMLFQLSEELTQRDQQIGELDELIKQQCKADERIKRLPEIDGIGPISASAVVAAIGDAKQFTGSRDLSPWALLTRGETYRPG